MVVRMPPIDLSVEKRVRSGAITPQALDKLSLSKLFAELHRERGP